MERVEQREPAGDAHPRSGYGRCGRGQFSSTIAEKAAPMPAAATR